jgi:N-glycosidase YbiA
MRRDHYAPTGTLWFYGGPLSSFAYRPVRIAPGYQGAPTDSEPEWYACREEYFQAAKATNREDHDWVLGRHKAKIGVPDDTWSVKKRGNNVPLRDDWETVKYDVMLAGLRAEVEQHADFRQYIQSLIGRRVEEDSPTDVIWGIKKRPDGSGGLNLLGLAIMQVCAELNGQGLLANVLALEAEKRMRWDRERATA